MTWYKTGTATVTNGSPTVTLAGANAQLNIFPDDGFVGPDGRLYAVLSVASATTFTLSTNYSGPTASAQPYLAVPVADHVQLRDLLISVNTLVGDYQTIANEAGAGRFPNGSAASPGVKGINNAGTGLVWTSNALSVSVNGTIVATFNAGGTSTITFPNGTLAAPGIRFTEDPDTGLFRYDSNGLIIVTGGVERLRFTPSGNIGINSASPYARLGVVTPTDTPTITVGIGESVGTTGIEFYGTINSLPPSQVRGFIATGNIAGGVNGDLLLGSRTSAPSAIRFYTGATGAQERLTIAWNGQILVNGGSQATPTYSFAESPTTGMFLATTTSLGFMNDGIRTWLFEGNGDFRPFVDNISSLGSAIRRPSVIYAATGTINTSDQNEKTTLRSFTPAELTASRRIAKIIGIFQWLTSIAEKGEDGARQHVGVIAQDVWNVMADEGLIAPLVEGETPSTKYGFLCYDEWEEETEPVMEEITIPAVLDDEGEVVEPERTEEQPTGETRVTMEAGKRFGILPDQLAMFLIAAQEARLTALEESL